jgi:hypothetical protein
VAEPEKFLSLTALAKALGVNPQRLIAMHDCGVITHDATSTQAILFKASRLSGLRAAVAKPFGLERAIKARQAQLRKS